MSKRVLAEEAPEDMNSSQGDAKKSESAVALSSKAVLESHRIVRFRRRTMLEVVAPYRHFVPLHKEHFDALAYPLLGGVSRSRMSDVFSFVGNVVEDLTPYEHLVMFGEAAPSENPLITSGVVWDCKELHLVKGDEAHAQQVAVWRSPYGVVPHDTLSEPIPFIMELASGDKGLYADIMQSIAPLIMDKKPDGVIWWVGDGANGKSTLMDALYRLFPGQFASLTVKRLVDGRDTPSLNGQLANVVRESSEGRVDDTEIYKAIGTHESFRVHKFHSQEDILVQGNLHHIFSANQVPIFNDKGYSARRRTFIIPFTNRFESDPTFEERTFNDEMFGRLLWQMMDYAKMLRRQGYRYKWSAATLAAKISYDTDANNAEEYAREIIQEGVVAFESFNPLRIDYNNWCGDQGFVPLGLHNLRRAMSSIGFERRSVQIGQSIVKRYCLPIVKATELQPLALGRHGLYTLAGFTPEPEPPEIPYHESPKEAEVEPEPTPEAAPLSRPILGDWSA